MILQWIPSVVSLWSTTPALAGPAWARIDGEHFIVYSDRGGEAASELEFELESFRTLLAETYPDLTDGLRRPALPVMAFSNSAEFSQFVTDDRASHHEPGVYETSGMRPLVVVDASRWSESSSEVYRSYVETLLDRRPRADPWLVLGLAEFYSTVRIEQRSGQDGEHIEAHIGSPIASDLDLLRTEKWIPFEHILAAQYSSPLVKNKKRRELFRAQAWLLVHWCQLDPTGERKALVDAMTERERRGGEVEPLYFSPLAVEKGWLNETLSTYLEEKSYRTYTVDLTGRVNPTTHNSVAVPPVEIEYRLGSALAYRRQYEQAEILFQHALSVDPTSWMPYDGLGLVAEANLSRAAAKKYFADAVARAPTSAGPYFDHGDSVGFMFNRKDSIAAARSSYERAITIDPSLLDAYAGLADLAYRERNWTESVRWSGRGLQIDPHDSLLRAMLGRAQFAVGDLAHARVNTQLALKECEDHRSCSEAAALVRVALSRL